MRVVLDPVAFSRTFVFFAKNPEGRCLEVVELAAANRPDESREKYHSDEQCNRQRDIKSRHQAILPALAPDSGWSIHDSGTRPLTGQ